MKKKLVSLILAAVMPLAVTAEVNVFAFDIVSASGTAMYSADGRIIYVIPSEVELYKAVGWYTEPPVLMYAADGRTLYVIPSEVELYKAVGWYTEPPVLMYAADGRTLYVIPSEVELYRAVGWYSSLAEAQYANNNKTIAEIVAAALPVIHNQNDTKYWKINDNYTNVDENSRAYMVAFDYNYVGDIPLDTFVRKYPGEGPDAAVYYIFEKGTGRILDIGYVQDFWPGIINEFMPTRAMASPAGATLSAEVGEVNGTVYSVREMPGVNLIPIRPEKGDYISSFCYYGGYVYYVEAEDGTSETSSWLYRCKPDWTGKQLLDSDGYHAATIIGQYFVIDNGILYYLSWDAYRNTLAINLNNLEELVATIPNYTVFDKGLKYSDLNIDLSPYNGNIFFIDNENALYKYENGSKQRLATNVSEICGYAGGYVYYTTRSEYNIRTYRVSVYGGNPQLMTTQMAAGE